MGVSKNRGGPPKWMVKIMENPIKTDDLGGKPTIFGNIPVDSFKLEKIIIGKMLVPLGWYPSCLTPEKAL